MARSWFKIWGPQLVGSDKWADLDPETRGAWITLLIQGSTQAPECRWSRRRAEAVLRGDGFPDPAGSLAALLSAGMLDADGDQLQAHDWDEWQASRSYPSETPEAWRERKRRQRDSRDIPKVPSERPDVPTRDIPSPLSSPLLSSDLPSGESEGAGLHHSTPEALAPLEAITGRSFLQAGYRQQTELDRLIEVHGPAAVARAASALAAGRRLEWRQLVWGIVKVLEPIPTGKEATAAVAEEEAEKIRQKRQERLQAQRELRERETAPPGPMRPLGEIMKGIGFDPATMKLGGDR